METDSTVIACLHCIQRNFSYKKLSTRRSFFIELKQRMFSEKTIFENLTNTYNYIFLTHFKSADHNSDIFQ